MLSISTSTLCRPSLVTDWLPRVTCCACLSDLISHSWILGAFSGLKVNLISWKALCSCRMFPVVPSLRPWSCCPDLKVSWRVYPSWITNPFNAMRKESMLTLIRKSKYTALVVRHLKMIPHLFSVLLLCSLLSIVYGAKRIYPHELKGRFKGVKPGWGEIYHAGNLVFPKQPHGIMMLLMLTQDPIFWLVTHPPTLFWRPH